MKDYASQLQSTLRVSMAVSLTLAFFKALAGVMTHSMVLIASALDSFADFGTSLVNMIAAREASKPPDEGHPYGHEKIESLAGLFQSSVIALSGLYLLIEAFRRFFSPRPLEQTSLGIAVIAASLGVTFVLSRYLRAKAAQTDSTLLLTEQLHYSMDFWAGGAALSALFLVALTGQGFWDVLFAVGAVLYILKQSFMILKRSVSELLDPRAESVSQEEIERLIHEKYPQIVGVHQFRSRRAGFKVFMDFHIEIRGEKNFLKAHEMTESLVRDIKIKHPEADVTIHYDPEGAE